MLPDFLSDISIKFASVPTSLNSVTACGVLWQTNAECFLLDVPRVARFLVEAGRNITIQPTTGADANKIERSLLMAPLAALLYQRGILAFHAAAVTNGHGAILLAGNSGVGKSTLLNVLLQRGWTMLADDLAVVDQNEQDQLVVRPTSQEIALWPDTLHKMGIDTGSLPYCDANRLGLSRLNHNPSAKVPLRVIYWLNINNNNETELFELKGSACFKSLGNLLYNSHIADAIIDRSIYMRYAMAIARSVPIKILGRPEGKWNLNELADLIAI